MPTFYDVLKKRDKDKLTRLRRVMREGSPRYHYDVPVIVAAAFVEFNCSQQFPLSRKYAPLDSMLVINTDAVDIAVLLNGAGGDNFIVPAHTIRNITPADCAVIGNVRITNNGGVASIVNLIDIDIWREAETVDSLARRSM